MKQLKTLLALVLCLALAMPCALAEGAYVPGETVKALFAEAWSKGQMITADLSFQLELDGAALGLTEEDLAEVNALTALLDAATLRMGVCRIDGGMRVQLAGLVKAQEGAQDVYVDAAVDITREGLSVDSSLLTGRRVSMTWATLLSLCGLDDDEVTIVVGLMDADWESMIGEILTIAQSYVSLAMQMLSPYGETVSAWAQTLAVETYTNVEATEDYPAAATLVNVYITEKDLGVLITELAAQLENDATLCLILDNLIREYYGGYDTPPTTAELCASLREGAASLTDEEYPLILSLATDEYGTPVYAELYNAESSGMAQYAGVFLYPDAADPELCNYELSVFTITPEGNADTGFLLSGTYRGDSDSPRLGDLTIDLVCLVDCAYIMGFSLSQSTVGMTTAEGLPGATSEGEMSMSVEDGDDSVMVMMNMQQTSSLTALGGEQTDLLETIDMYVGEQQITAQVLGTMIVEPGASGLTGSYSVLETMPDLGIERYGVQMLFASEDYVPAALTEIALETATDETMNAIAAEVTAAAQALAMQFTQAVPADTLELVSEIVDEL